MLLKARSPVVDNCQAALVTACFSAPSCMCLLAWPACTVWMDCWHLLQCGLVQGPWHALGSSAELQDLTPGYGICIELQRPLRNDFDSSYDRCVAGTCQKYQA